MKDLLGEDNHENQIDFMYLPGVVGLNILALIHRRFAARLM